MAIYDGNTGRLPVQTSGEYDYVRNGNVYLKQAVKSVLVRSADDQPLLSGYAPGSIAHTAGFKDMWELDANGLWVSLLD